MKSLTETIKESMNTISDCKDVLPLSEANLNHIMKNAEKNGIMIISANRSFINSDNKNTDLSKDYEMWLKKNHNEDTDEMKAKFLEERNREEYKNLYKDIKSSPYSYTQVYGGYKGTDSVVDEYEPSILVYCVGRNGVQIPFEDLFEFGKELCSKYKQDSFFAQAPGEAPNHYDLNGNIINTRSSRHVKFNRDREMFYTTTKRKKNNPQRFTSDIVYEDFGNLKEYLLENYCKEFGIQYAEKMRRTQAGEYLFV